MATPEYMVGLVVDDVGERDWSVRKTVTINIHMFCLYVCPRNAGHYGVVDDRKRDFFAVEIVPDAVSLPLREAHTGIEAIAIDSDFNINFNKQAHSFLTFNLIGVTPLC